MNTNSTWVCLQSHSLNTLIEMQGNSSSPSPMSLRTAPLNSSAQTWPSYATALKAAVQTLHLPIMNTVSRRASVGLSCAMGDDSTQTRFGVPNASTVDPDTVQFCRHDNGEKCVLGMGSWGVVRERFLVPACRILCKFVTFVSHKPSKYTVPTVMQLATMKLRLHAVRLNAQNRWHSLVSCLSLQASSPVSLLSDMAEALAFK